MELTVELQEFNVDVMYTSVRYLCLCMIYFSLHMCDYNFLNVHGQKLVCTGIHRT